MELKNQFTDLFESIPNAKVNYSPSEYAEKFRTLSSDVSTIQGKFNYKITPYLREIVDTLSPYHPAKIVAVIKAAQIGYTDGVIVNGILWLIANNPGNIMSLSANDSLSKEMVESRLDPGIASCGIQHLIRPNTIRKRNQRTGDTSQSKEFAGGRAFFGGLQSIDKLGKQRSIKYGFFDDWDAAPISDKKQGSVFELLQQRFATAANSMKQYYISTPETRPSNIENVYLKGDQRKWKLPCPKCGEFIEIIWHDVIEGEKVGVYFDIEDEKLVENSVGYVCQKCGQFFKENHKYEMNLNGMWEPTAEPSRPGFYSYHITALTSAPHMYSWKDYAYKWIDINGSNSKRKVFYNLVLGQAWEEKNEQIKKNKLAMNCRDYEIYSVPAELSVKDGNGEIIILTCACDLNGTLDDARLDYEVVAHCETGSTYSIDQGSIGTYQPGKKKEGRELWTYRNNDINNVWDIFHLEVVERVYYSDDGRELKIVITGIDTGYMTTFAYNFMDSYPSKYVGVKGKVDDKFRKTGHDYKKFKPALERNNLYILEVDLVKDDLADMINLDWNKKESEAVPQHPGFMNFPSPSDGKYHNSKFFKQLESEQKVIELNDDGEPIGWKWKKKAGTQNHFFDCRVYNLALRDIYAHIFGKAMKRKFTNWAEFVNVAKGII